MTRRPNAYDAIVIGAGHNGLVCAAYLARGGLRVMVVEARDTVGGLAETAELWPGVRVPAVAHTVGRLRPQVARDLRLRDHGLRLVQPPVRVFAPQSDRRGLTLWGDAEATARGFADSDGLIAASDAASYVAVDARFRALAGALAQLHSRVPVDLAAPTLGNAMAGLRTAIAARARTRESGVSLLRVMPMAVRDLVDEWFDSDALRAAVAARGVLLTGMAPRMPGTTGVLLTDAACNEGGLAGQTVFARGGPGALSEALAEAARSLGAELRTGARVARVRHTGDFATGVALSNGDEIDAPVVVSSLDPRTTLLDLLEPEVLGPHLSWRAMNIRQRGHTAKVNFALRGLPNFPAAADDPRKLRGRILFAPSMAALDEAARPAKYGELPDHPLVEATIPTLTDPTLIDPARAGAVTHILSAVVEGIPFDTDGVAEAVIRTIELYAPGFSDIVESHHVITPVAIERDYGASGGHPMHAEVGLDQWFEWRPLHGFGRYRMPLGGYYLAGSGAHPGGGITGGPGQLAADQILTDVKTGGTLRRV